MNNSALTITKFIYPQGCLGYILEDPKSKGANIIDPHLDYIFYTFEKTKNECGSCIASTQEIYKLQNLNRFG